MFSGISENLINYAFNVRLTFRLLTDELLMRYSTDGIVRDEPRHA